MRVSIIGSSICYSAILHRFGNCAKGCGWRQLDLAEQAGINDNDVSDLELGNKEICLRTLKAVALAESQPQFIGALMNDMGFDNVDAGALSASWRQQPGTPAYATDHNVDMLKSELSRVDRKIAPQMRDALLQKLFSPPPDTTPQDVVKLARSLWIKQLAD